jgi:hypothetical protein
MLGQTYAANGLDLRSAFDLDGEVGQVAHLVTLLGVVLRAEELLLELLVGRTDVAVVFVPLVDLGRGEPLETHGLIGADAGRGVVERHLLRKVVRASALEVLLSSRLRGSDGPTIGGSAVLLSDTV